MAVIKMKKLSVFAHRRDADALVRRLMRLRCVELKPIDDTDADECLLETYGGSEKLSDLEKQLSRTTEALSLMSKYNEAKKGLISKPISVRLDRFKTDGSYAKAVGIVDGVIELADKKEKIKNERSRLEALLGSLSLWRAYELPLDFAGTKSTSVFTATLPPTLTDKRIDEALGDTAAQVIRVGGDKVASCVCVICARGEEDEAARKLSSIGMLKTQFSELHGAVSKIYSSTKKQLAAIEKDELSIEEKMREYGKETELVQILYDAVATSIEAEKNKQSLLSTEYTVVLGGWVPERDEKRVFAALSKFECAYEISEADEADEPPVLLKNNFFASSFEWVLGMYSYPKYGSFDPTFIMSIFYFIIFGLMFADVGYGFLLVVCCFGAILLLNPKKSMRNFLAMFGYCGISSMIMGVLFGAYFGNLPQAYSEYMLGVEGATSTMQTAVLFDPLLDPMSFLILSIAVGAVHLVAGMAVQFYVLCRKGQVVDAFCDIASWWLTFAGIGLAVAFPWGKYVAIAGAASIVLTAGRREKKIVMKLAKGALGLYGAVNYVSDLLSYSRILALGLAASVIAQVINTMGTMGGPNIVGFLMMIAVFIVGHLLNLAINVLGTFVHTSRLQYIEFFGKFYEDGGKPFKPAVPSDKYTTEQ
ncbi:MAG: V-type ATP synthase subunit I [Clostridia bacterium]|nr:V-type ATP synthase subunit I [Clostridia bacterium]